MSMEDKIEVAEKINIYTARKRFWRAWHELLTQSFYYELLLDHDKFWDNMHGCIVSVGSIGGLSGWVLVKKDPFPFIWSLMIVGTQIYGRFQKFFPSKQRLNLLPQVFHDLSILRINYESFLIKFKNDEPCMLGEIDSSYIKLKKETQEVINKYFPQGSYSVKKRILKKAEGNVTKYIDRYYLNDDNRAEDLKKCTFKSVYTCIKLLISKWCKK